MIIVFLVVLSNGGYYKFYLPMVEKNNKDDQNPRPVDLHCIQ